MDPASRHDRDAALLPLRHRQDHAAARRDHLHRHVPALLHERRAHPRDPRRQARRRRQRRGRRSGRRHAVLLLLRRPGVHRVRRRRRAASASRCRFLIASPMVNEIAIGMLLTLFGVEGHRRSTSAPGCSSRSSRAGCSAASASSGGSSRSCSRPSSAARPSTPPPDSPSTTGSRWASRRSARILRKIWPYLLVGIGLGAVIHGWVPTEFFTTYAGPGSTFGVLIAVGDRHPALLQRRRHHAAWSRPSTRRACRWGPCSRS